MMTQSITATPYEVTTGKRPHEVTSSSPLKRRRTVESPNHDELIKVVSRQIDSFDKDDVSPALEEHEEHESFSNALPSHPLGIKPLGNLYSATQPNLKTHAGSFAWLPDELIVHILEQVSSQELLLIGATCKALCAFARYDELWKNLIISFPLGSVREGQELDWHGSWRATYLHLPKEQQSKIDCTGLYSDTLYRPFHCSHLPLQSYVNPKHFRSHIPKLPDLSPEAFQSEWVDKPVILTEPVKSWSVFRDCDFSELRPKQLKQGSNIFRCEAVDWPLDTYMQYLRDSDDESPLYLFDSKFVEKMGLKVGDPEAVTGSSDGENVDYTPPQAFYPDYFTVLRDERPAHRWLIMGPPRSGSSFHIDPNGTSAWNAVLRGRKYWIMSPTPPPGVYVSEDESEVTSPSSIAEWLMWFHKEARNTPGVCEGICEEGEVLHVPGGWYHLVLNIPSEDGRGSECTVAITQNFVPKTRLEKVLRFLRDRPDQVSGFQFSDDNQDERSESQQSRFNAYDLFVERLEEKYPGSVEGRLGDSSLSNDPNEEPTLGLWAEVVKDKEAEGGFSFGFGADEENEEVAEADDNHVV